ncbi:helix-turn-helix transcriptional regulator [Pseudoxanthomonas sp.]|uniref:helix-turn-helix domain-containing protein n=1 Tax=Pseudoxanthomonas sp. TaxID=1871049 RepID=UPI0028C486D6|nr:helix-turn-helix transcriptional regulator [Pseudoxanthomonas sp.]
MLIQLPCPFVAVASACGKTRASPRARRLSTYAPGDELQAPPLPTGGDKSASLGLVLCRPGGDLGGDAEQERFLENTGAPRISRYETGLHDPDPKTAEAIAKALGLPLAYFYATSDPLAEIILLVAKMPEDRQREAVAALKAIAGKA